MYRAVPGFLIYLVKYASRSCVAVVVVVAMERELFSVVERYG